ncbi:Cell death protease [Phlyctochytrium bullatum]|nr:Cell death protease [Phlyctochytrium bullatum]
MHAGLINVTDTDSLFFWLVRNRTESPGPRKLLIWLNGGPGCSSMDGMFMEYGPLRVDPTGQKVSRNPWSWHRHAAVVFVDQPVRTGYSVGPKPPESLAEATKHFVTFLKGFLDTFGEFRGAEIYIGGESFAGVYVPYYATAILEKKYPVLADEKINLAGLLLGNPSLEPFIQTASLIPFALRNNLVTPAQVEKLRAPLEQCRQAALEKDSASLPKCSAVLQGILKFSTANNGSCVNMYDVRLRDETPDDGCGLFGWPPELKGMRTYLSRADVKVAVHAVPPAENRAALQGDDAADTATKEWVECNTEVSVALRKDQTGASVMLLPKLLARLPVTVFSGDQDLICNVDGVTAVLEAMTWNGAKGLGTAAAMKGWWLPDKRAVGTVRSARNLTNVVLFGASHMAGVGMGEETLDLFARFVGVQGAGTLSDELPTKAGANLLASDALPKTLPFEQRRNTLPPPPPLPAGTGRASESHFGASPFGRVQMGERVRVGEPPAVKMPPGAKFDRLRSEQGVDSPGERGVDEVGLTVEEVRMLMAGTDVGRQAGGFEGMEEEVRDGAEGQAEMGGQREDLGNGVGWDMDSAFVILDIMTFLHSLPTEVIHRIVLHYLSPLDASRLMTTSRYLRSFLKPLPITLARKHLIGYLRTHFFIASLDTPSNDEAEPFEVAEDEDDDDEVDEEVEEELLKGFPRSSLPMLEGANVDWSLIRWEDGVDEVYWAALFADFGFKAGMAVVAESCRTAWTKEQMEHFTLVYSLFYQPHRTELSYYTRFEQLHSSKLEAPGPFPSPNPGVTNALFNLVQAGLCPPRPSFLGALAHVALFRPNALFALLSALPVIPHEDLPTLLTLLAYLNHADLIVKVLSRYPPLPPPNGPGSLPHRAAAAVGNVEALRVLLDLLPADLSVHHSEILRLACKNGHTDIFRLLLDHSVAAAALGIQGVDPSVWDNSVLYGASSENRADIVKLLLDHSITAVPLGIPGVDPSEYDSSLLRIAGRDGYAAEVVKLLLDHSLAAAPRGNPCGEPLGPQ